MRYRHLMSSLDWRTTVLPLALSTVLTAAAARPARAEPRPGTARVAEEDSGEEPSEKEPSEKEPPEDGMFGPPVEIAEERVRWFSLTFSPIHLALPFVEVTGEFRVGEDLGIAAIAGAGDIKAKETDQRYKVYELGAQARYYVYGDFTRGFDVGIEAIYLAAYDETGSAIIRGEGVTVGGYGGYKRVLNGVTIDLQLGAQVLAVRTATEQESKAGALVNVNFGYTF